MVCEPRAGDRRADLLTITRGGLVAWEIKTGYDTLGRLGAQVDAYCRAWEQVTVLCDPSMVDAATRTVPDHVGVATMEATIRPPVCDPARTRALDTIQEPR